MSEGLFWSSSDGRPNPVVNTNNDDGVRLHGDTRIVVIKAPASIPVYHNWRPTITPTATTEMVRITPGGTPTTPLPMANGLPRLVIIDDEYDPTRSVPAIFQSHDRVDMVAPSPQCTPTLPQKLIIPTPTKRVLVPVPNLYKRRCTNHIPYFMKGPWLIGYLVLTLAHGILEGFYLGVAYATTAGILIAGMMVIPWFFLCFGLQLLDLAKGICCGAKVPFISFVAVICLQASAAFAGLYGGSLLQQNWYLDQIPKYVNVSASNPGAVSKPGQFTFLPGAYVATNYSGYITYITSGKNPRRIWVCAAPIFPAEGLQPPYPQSVRFWVVGVDCCHDWGPINNDCIWDHKWDNPGGVGVTIRDGDSTAEKQAQVPPATTAYYLVNETIGNITQTVPALSAFDMQFINWTTQRDIDASYHDRWIIGMWVTLLHIIIWPCWTCPIWPCILIVFKPDDGWCGEYRCPSS